MTRNFFETIYFAIGGEGGGVQKTCIHPYGRWWLARWRCLAKGSTATAAAAEAAVSLVAAGSTAAAAAEGGGSGGVIAVAAAVVLARWQRRRC